MMSDIIKCLDFDFVDEGIFKGGCIADNEQDIPLLLYWNTLMLGNEQ